MSVFRFKEFSITQSDSAMKVGTDAMLLGSFVEVQETQRVLDIGAGTGVVSLMIAQKYPEARIEAVEIDPFSAQECQLNFEASKWADQLIVHQADFLDLETDGMFDLIVSNPPYYQTRFENDDERVAKAKHESSLPMHSFLEGVERRLTNAGSFWLILPFEDLASWIKSANQFALYPKHLIHIKGKSSLAVKRVIAKFSKSEEETTTTEFIVRNTDGSYTEEYIELTKAYHFNDLRVR